MKPENGSTYAKLRKEFHTNREITATLDVCLILCEKISVTLSAELYPREFPKKFPQTATIIVKMSNFWKVTLFGRFKRRNLI